MAVEAVWAPLGASALCLRVYLTPRVGRGEALTLGSKEAGPTPERSSEVERAPEGSGEPGTLSVGPDWTIAVPIIILGVLRPMSFNSCLIRVP
jgi:hypothetical protein